MSELTKEQREELKGLHSKHNGQWEVDELAVAATEAVLPLIHQVERLERSLAMAGEVQLTGHHHWGMQLMEQLGRFIEQTATAATPMTTKIMARFTDVDFPAMHIWATTSEQEPAARCGELAAARAALEAAVAERDKEIASLRQQLSAAEERAGKAEDREKIWSDGAKAGGLDLSPCMICGDPVVCLPDGMPMCESCGQAAQAAGKAE
jgi:hypothetical protein